MIAGGFGSAVLVGTGLLSLPFATESGERAPLVDALFTATSAVCVTGLITVDTGGYWSTFGEVVIMALIQVGGLGIMTLATLVTLLLAGRVGLRARLLAQAETKTLGLRDVRRVVRNIVIFSLVCEAIVATVLVTRFFVTYDMSFGAALYDGGFHAVSAFNNAGFSLNSDSLMGFAADPWVSGTVAAAFITGGLGFPVVFELLRSWRRPREWSVVTRLTVGATIPLLVFGTIAITVAEYSNPDTIGSLDESARPLAGFFSAATPRSAGFNVIDTERMSPEGYLLTDILMFVGGGSAGTAGGIKVTTFALLAFVIWAELRGDTHVNVGHRRIPESTQRQAITIALIYVGLLAVFSVSIEAMSAHDLDRTLFDATSAVGTVGLSSGVVEDLPRLGHILITVMMFLGRIGPLTLGSALALRERARRYELPEERPIVG
ncbi:MAG: TrkH family potassium uptake protein [Propionibacteriales bacterium]|nr:TrkH family potassium uptake protein [Propionibacteriales bacterium]